MGMYHDCRIGLRQGPSAMARQRWTRVSKHREKTLEMWAREYISGVKRLWNRTKIHEKPVGPGS